MATLIITTEELGFKFYSPEKGYDFTLPFSLKLNRHVNNNRLDVLNTVDSPEYKIRIDFSDYTTVTVDGVGVADAEALQTALEETSTGGTLNVAIVDPLNSEGQVKVVLDGKIDTNNSTMLPLAGSGIYQGSSTNTLDYALIFVTVFSDVASKTDGLIFETSSDNVSWRNSDVYTIPANTEKTFSFQVNKAYYKIRYENDSTIQTVFDLQTIIKKQNSKPSSHRIQDPISSDDDATLQKAVLTALNDLNVFANIGATASNNLRVTDAESGLAIAKGDVVGTSVILKFGSAPDFDDSDGEVTIWDGTEDGTAWELMQYVYSTTANIDSLSSSNAGDTQDIEIQGLDTNFNLVIQTITLSGQTRVPLTTNLIRIFRAKNVNSTDLTGHVFVYVNGATTGGVPDTNADIRCIVQPENNQTEMAVFTVPAGKTGYLRRWYSSTAGASKNSNYIIKLKARPFGQVFQLKHKDAISDNATSYISHNYTEPQKFTEKTDIEMTAEITDSPITGASVTGGFDIVLIDN